MNATRSHILVLDDLADGADSTVELLDIWGYDACACYTGAAALESARARRPDAVLLELWMPHMDGFRFADLFREQPGRASIPLIAVSCYWSREFYARARAAGVCHYLLKPADPVNLEELLGRLVGPLQTRVPEEAGANAPGGSRSRGGEPIGFGGLSGKF